MWKVSPVIVESHGCWREPCLSIRLSFSTLSIQRSFSVLYQSNALSLYLSIRLSPYVINPTLFLCTYQSDSLRTLSIWLSLYFINLTLSVLYQSDSLCTLSIRLSVLYQSDSLYLLYQSDSLYFINPTLCTLSIRLSLLHVRRFLDLLQYVTQTLLHRSVFFAGVDATYNRFGTSAPV